METRNITISDDKIVTVKEQSGLFSKEKTISFEELSKSLQKFNRPNDSDTDSKTPMFPSKHGIAEIKRLGNHKTIISYVTPAGIHKVQFGFSKHFDIFIPKTVWVVAISENNRLLTNYELTGYGAFFDDHLTDYTKLYQIPLYNLFENSEICWGDNKIMIDPNNLENFPAINKLFYSLPSNTDLYPDINGQIQNDLHKALNESVPLSHGIYDKNSPDDNLFGLQYAFDNLELSIEKIKEIIQNDQFGYFDDIDDVSNLKKEDLTDHQKWLLFNATYVNRYEEPYVLLDYLTKTKSENELLNWYSDHIPETEHTYGEVMDGIEYHLDY